MLATMLHDVHATVTRAVEVVYDVAAAMYASVCVTIEFFIELLDTEQQQLKLAAATAAATATTAATAIASAVNAAAAAVSAFLSSPAPVPFLATIDRHVGSCCGHASADADADGTPLPCVAELQYRQQNAKFRFNVGTFGLKCAAMFDDWEEYFAVCRVLEAVHAHEQRLIYRRWLLPYMRLLFVRFGRDEDRVFAHIVRHPHLVERMSAKSEEALWCWTMGCACSKPRHKADWHADEIYAVYNSVLST